MWIVYALLTIFSYAGLDFFIKKMADHINDFVGIIILGLFSVVPALAILLIFNFPTKKLLITSPGILYATLGGLALGIGTLSFLKLFDSGINLSLASPFVRIGIMVITTALGMFFLRETVEPKEWLGIALALIGMVIVVWK